MAWGNGKKTLFRLMAVALIFCHPGTAGAERLNINTATADQLTSLPYIGTIRARIIIDCRKSHGPFNDLNDLLACQGIGPDTLKAMRADIEVAEGSNRPPAPLSNADPAGEKAKQLQSATGNILLLANKDYLPALLDKIRNAQKSIDLSMFVFKTTKSTRDRPSMIIAELKAVAQWGVKVRVFLEESRFDENLNDTNRKTAEELRKQKGIEVIFDSPNITTHTKIAVIDHRYSFIGSHNFTNSALGYNNELSLMVDDRKLAREVTEYLDSIIGNRPQ